MEIIMVGKHVHRVFVSQNVERELADEEEMNPSQLAGALISNVDFDDSADVTRQDKQRPVGLFIKAMLNLRIHKSHIVEIADFALCCLIFLLACLGFQINS